MDDRQLNVRESLWWNSGCDHFLHQYMICYYRIPVISLNIYILHQCDIRGKGIRSNMTEYAEECTKFDLQLKHIGWLDVQIFCW